MSCVVADNSSSALKIPLLDYLLLHKDPPSYLSDPHTAKTTDNTILVHQDHQRAEQIQGQVFPPQRQQLKERQNNSIYTWGLTAEVTSCLDQFQNNCNTQLNLFTSCNYELFSVYDV